MYNPMIVVARSASLTLVNGKLAPAGKAGATEVKDRFHCFILGQARRRNSQRMIRIAEQPETGFAQQQEAEEWVREFFVHCPALVNTYAVYSGKGVDPETLGIVGNPKELGDMCPPRGRDANGAALEACKALIAKKRKADAAYTGPHTEIEKCIASLEKYLARSAAKASTKGASKGRAAKAKAATSKALGETVQALKGEIAEAEKVLAKVAPTVRKADKGETAAKN